MRPCHSECTLSKLARVFFGLPAWRGLWREAFAGNARLRGCGVGADSWRRGRRGGARGRTRDGGAGLVAHGGVGGDGAAGVRLTVGQGQQQVHPDGGADGEEDQVRVDEEAGAGVVPARGATGVTECTSCAPRPTAEGLGF